MRHKTLIELYVLLRSRGTARKRAAIYRRLGVFHRMGTPCLYQPVRLPSEPNLVSIGDNVNIAAGVTFVTHDVIHSMLIYKNDPAYPVSDNGFYMGTIQIGDNVMIGQNAILMYNTRIGSNVIVAAGSVVTKDVPDGAIVGGNPARVIGSLQALARKRATETMGMPDDNAPLETINRYFWK